jgi:diguanylate cyclase (GGDEF)-like protein
MVSGPAINISEQLDALRERFVEKTRGQLQDLSDMVERIRNESALESDLSNIYQMLHRLAGSSGTFGFDALGKRARDLEQQVKPLVELARETALSPESKASVIGPRFEESVASLNALLDHEPRTPDPADDNVRAEEMPGHVESQDAGRLLIVWPEWADASEADNLTRALKEEGFSADHATPEGLLSLLRADEVSVVLCHDSLAGAVAERLQTYSGQPGGHLVPFLTVNQDESFSRSYELAALGAFGTFTMPVDVPALGDRIERILSEQASMYGGRVLIVDDDLELLEHYALVLETAGLSVRTISEPENLLQALSEFDPDIVFMDLRIGAFSGTTLARMIRFDARWIGLPIVYLSSEKDQTAQLEALSEGADEFITKPVSDHYLVNVSRVRCYRAKQLDKLISRDSLTGLLKHSLIKQEVQKEYARAKRSGYDSVVAMVDLDHFKRVNDTWGHRTRDQVIKALAQALRLKLRKTDVIGRYGGEEFLVVMPECRPEDARRVLQALCDHFAQLTFNAEDSQFRVTLSAGASDLLLYPDADTAMEAADQALYLRKSAGRNGVTMAGDTSA